jgi:hypothetical protein
MRGVDDLGDFLEEGLSRTRDMSCIKTSPQSFGNVFFGVEQKSMKPMALAWNADKDRLIAGGGIEVGSYDSSLCPQEREVWNEFGTSGGHITPPSKWGVSTEEHTSQTPGGGATFHAGIFEMYLRGPPSSSSRPHNAITIDENNKDEKNLLDVDDYVRCGQVVSFLNSGPSGSLLGVDNSCSQAVGVRAFVLRSCRRGGSSATAAGIHDTSRLHYRDTFQIYGWNGGASSAKDFRIFNSVSADIFCSDAGYDNSNSYFRFLDPEDPLGLETKPILHGDKVLLAQDKDNTFLMSPDRVEALVGGLWPAPSRQTWTVLISDEPEAAGIDIAQPSVSLQPASGFGWDRHFHRRALRNIQTQYIAF